MLKRAVQRVCARYQPVPSVPAAGANKQILRPLNKVILTDELSRTLFTEFADHRSSSRASEETGWALLGLRGEESALVLASLPAGEQRDASYSHVQFNPVAQAMASTIVRQDNKLLTLLGIVHTHPASLRHPSQDDYRGDITWVRGLKGQEGVFAIGTSDAEIRFPAPVAWSDQPHTQCLGHLRFTWYALSGTDRNYRTLPVQLTIGPDLALPVRKIWYELEKHAEEMERLSQILSHVRFDIIQGAAQPALVLNLKLSTNSAVRVVMEGDIITYVVLNGEEARIAKVHEERLDRGLLFLLAELL